jgi:hypothetical protein
MISTRTLGIVLGATALLAGAACADLEVTNPNNPDVDRALSSPEDVRNVAISSVVSWYGTVTNTSPWMALSVTSDAYTSAFGNYGMRFLNTEPRQAYINNSADADNGGVALSLWNGTYGDLGIANDAIRAMDDGIVINTPRETDKYRALALFIQAASLANLGLYFDQAYVVDETTDPEAQRPPLQPYGEVLDAAMEKWDALIALASDQEETYDASVLPLEVGPLTSERLAQIGNTMAARTLAYAPRTAAQNEGVDWARVLAYAEAGISTGSRFDMTVVNDFNNWASTFGYYGNEPSWARVDMRLINRMDPTQPAKFTGTIPPEATSADARLESDFEFLNNTGGWDPARGIYMQSPYAHKRYRYLARTSPTRGRGPAPYVLAAENDLLIAEALIRTGGSLARAAELINGSRVGRGHLAPVSAADGREGLLAAIFYERDIELLSTNGVEFLDMRRTDRLQPGSIRHLPVAARELETVGLPIYTYGGVGNPDMRRQGRAAFNAAPMR